MNYSGVGPRFVAWLVDLVVIIPLYAIMVTMFGNVETGGGSFSVSLNGFPAIVFFALVVGYYVYCESQMGGTLGKLATGLRVVNENGENISYNQALGRTLLRIVDGILIYLVGAIFIWTSDKKQRLGDKAANTFVVPKNSLTQA